MTFKFVGALDSLQHPNPKVMVALGLGIGIGLVTEVLRKVIKGRASYRPWVESSSTGYYTDLALDCAVLQSPYASSFGGFVNFGVAVWYGLGGVFSSLFNTWQARKPRTALHEGLPEDMSTTALVGGGIIAGDALASLSVGIYQLIRTMVH